MKPLPVIDPKWRTQTVVELCASMREAQDFSASPILADALQDAGCDNDELLAELRHGPVGAGGRAVAVVYGEESREAVQWIEDFAGANDGSGYSDHYSRAWTYDDFVIAAADYLKTGDYITGGSELEGVSVPDLFWEKYEMATGRRAPEGKRGNFFNCSC